MTEFELWHRKKDALIVNIEENDRMRWGSRLEEAIALGIAEDNAWLVRNMEEYIRDPEHRLGASFDFGILKKPTMEDPPTVGEDLDAILEIKNVDSLMFRDGWIVDGETVEAPPHIELQVQQQLMLTGLSYAKIGAFIGGNKVVLIHREPDENIHAAIKGKAKKFWSSIEENTPPKPNFSKDADFISELYAFAEPGKRLDVRGNSKIYDLARAYKVACDDEKLAKEAKDAAKAQLLMAVGDAEKAEGDGFSISAGVIGPAQINYTREPYRSFRINWKKERS